MHGTAAADNTEPAAANEGCAIQKTDSAKSRDSGKSGRTSNTGDDRMMRITSIGSGDVMMRIDSLKSNQSELLIERIESARSNRSARSKSADGMKRTDSNKTTTTDQTQSTDQSKASRRAASARMTRLAAAKALLESIGQLDGLVGSGRGRSRQSDKKDAPTDKKDALTDNKDAQAKDVQAQSKGAEENKEVPRLCKCPACTRGVRTSFRGTSALVGTDGEQAKPRIKKSL